MGIKAAHIINGFDYLPYGKVDNTNTQKYLTWLKTINSINQLYWTSYVSDFADAKIMNELSQDIVFAGCRTILYRNNLSEFLDLIGCQVKIRGAKENAISRVICKWVAYPKTSTLNDLVLYLIKKADDKLVSLDEIEYTVNIELDDKFILRHYLYHGAQAGYYEDFRYSYGDFDLENSKNIFVPLSPRNAFIETHLSHLI